MKIGFFTNTYYPNTYGSTVSIEYFRKGLERLGNEVFIFTPKFRDYSDNNKRIIRYPSVIWKYKIEYPLAISIYPPLSGLIRKLELDVIHSHQPFSVGKDGMRQAIKLGIPLVFTHHCRYEDYTHYVPIIPQGLLRWHVKKMATIFANRCDRVISPTEQIRQMISKRGVKTPISVLPTGIDWEKYQTGNRRIIRNKYGIKEDEICLLWIGRMQAEKNLGFLLSVVTRTLEKNKSAKMILVGSGPEKDYLVEKTKKEGIGDRVFFAGLIDQKKIQDYYAAGDIFLQTSLTETQGMATTEALASGLAVVAIKATGAMDLVRDGETGILVGNNLVEFMTALQSLIINRSEIGRLGRNARILAKKFDYFDQSKQLHKIYEQLVAEKKRKLS